VREAGLGWQPWNFLARAAGNRPSADVIRHPDVGGKAEKPRQREPRRFCKRGLGVALDAISPLRVNPPPLPTTQTALAGTTDSLTMEKSV